MKRASVSRREKWLHLSSGEAELLRVSNKWSAGVKPVVFHKAIKVNSESVGAEGDKECPEEREQKKHYGYKDEFIHVLQRDGGGPGKRKNGVVGLTRRTMWMLLVCCIFSMRDKFL